MRTKPWPKCLRVTINMASDAFAEGNWQIESARILREVADFCDGRYFAYAERKLHDINGNVVGTMRLSARAQKGVQ